MGEVARAAAPPLDRAVTGTPHGPTRPARAVMWGGVGIGVLVAAAVCYAVASQTWTVGSAEGRFVYPYIRPMALRQILVAAAILACAVALLAFPVTNGRSVRVLLCAWLVFAMGAHLAIRTLAPYDLQTLFVSTGANSFYTLAQERSPSDLLSRFPRLRRQAPLHAQSNMPGKTLLVHALQTVSSRPDVLPWLVVLLSNLGAVLAFGVTRQLLDDDRMALNAAVLYLFTPARLFFFPLMNAVTPVFVLGLAWLVIRWLRTGRSAHAVLAGGALYALVFFEPLPLVMGLLFAVQAVASIARREIALERFLLQSIGLAVAFVLAAAAVYLLTGFDTLRAFRDIRAHAVEFNQAEGRSYAVWVRANLVEFFAAAGPAQMVLAATALAVACPARGAGRWLTAPVTVLSGGLFAVLIATDLIGINRGEITRLWIFLACLFQIPAAYVCARLAHGGAIAAVLAVTVLQVCIATGTIGFVLP